MIKVSFNVDEPCWRKEMPLFRKSILKAAKVTLAMANNSKNNRRLQKRRARDRAFAVGGLRLSFL